MCEYPWENGKAERINGVIKNNYLVHRKIEDYSQLCKEVDRAVKLYNTDKPHIKLQRMTPMHLNKKLVTLQQPTKLTMTESFDAKPDLAGRQPLKSEPTKPQNLDVFSAISISKKT
ncbi:MAG: transposase [Saprospiraceae bacterium]|nr:transposase [Candidatus Brachybacter algidus]